MIYIESTTTNPCFNLALEQFVFDSMDRTKDYIILWQNHNTIVVGKNQNTIAEINQEFVQQNKITVVRRLSGGGAVYHDLGNLNFTIIVSQKDKIADFDFARFNKPVVRVLKKLGIKAEITGRNDITIEDKKISGNAQYVKDGRIMDHGAILYDTDLSVLSKALRVSKDKIASKGISSVQSRVTNIVDYLKGKMPLAEFKTMLVQEIAGQEKIEQHFLTNKEVAAIEHIKNERYDTWEWNYGKSPKFSVKKERYIPGCGTFQLYLNVKNGSIEKIDMFGDYFGNKGKKSLTRKLEGIKLNHDALKNALADEEIEQYFHNLSKEKFIEMLV